MKAGLHLGRLSLVEESRFNGRHGWLCVCECGKSKWIRSDSLKSGVTVSCGCYSARQTAKRNTSHNASRSRCYRIWHGMLNRCYRHDHDTFSFYGGRGIQVCPRWLESFEAFREDMGDPPAGHQIDRIDTNRDYEPENCRWVSSKENANNRRNTVRLELNGVTKSISEWADELGISRQTIATRLYRGFSVENVLSLKNFRNRIEK